MEAAPEQFMGARARMDVTEEPSVYVGGKGAGGKHERVPDRKESVGRLVQEVVNREEENLSSSSLPFHGVLS